MTCNLEAQTSSSRERSVSTIHSYVASKLFASEKVDFYYHVLLAKAPNVGQDGCISFQRATINRCNHEQRISQSQRFVVDVDPFAHSLKVGNGRPIRWLYTTLSFMSEQQTTGTTWPDPPYLHDRSIPRRTHQPATRSRFHFKIPRTTIYRFIYYFRPAMASS
ncbi:hypothetical protein BJV82DRAFT_42636 [Fennellomyces sp. T-0311]|nr:hypothetical protein BJV82DRAFT_42636 [Fennellomyces sp. T-0311]